MSTYFKSFSDFLQPYSLDTRGTKGANDGETYTGRFSAKGACIEDILTYTDNAWTKSTYARNNNRKDICTRGAYIKAFLAMLLILEMLVYGILVAEVFI